MMVDTQILSYAFKGHRHLDGVRISSVVAHEFLESYDPESRTNAKYYIRYHPGHAVPPRREIPSDHKPTRGERLVFDFGGEYPKLVQHGSRSMAALLNDRNGPAFASIIWSLDKKLQKRLKQRFAFLCTAIGECVPLSRETADVGLTLLAKFCETHNIKDNVRNSVNDVMILAAAITSGEPLDTADTLLSRFAADAYKAVAIPIGGDSLRIDFRRARQGKKRDSAESKGYINRGWQIAEGIKRTAARA